MKKLGVVFILVIILSVCGIFFREYFYTLWKWLTSISIQDTRMYIESFGSWAIVVYILLYILNTFSPLLPPILFMSLIAGVVFGPILGTIALTIATFAATSTVFLTTRYVGRRWVERLLSGKNAKIDEQLSQNGFYLLVPMRLIGLPPYGIIDMICGLSRMTYLDFISATMIGCAPWIIVQVLLADRVTQFDPKDPMLWLLLVGFILMLVVTSKMIKARKPFVAKS